MQGDRGARNRRANDFDPIHPYTKKLMGSIIVPEEGMKGHKLAAIPGTPPNLKTYRRVAGLQIAVPMCKTPAVRER